jgi:prolyl oligopeptidase
VSVGLVDAGPQDDHVFLQVTGFLTPSELWLADAGTGTAAQVKSLPPQFDASGLVVEQLDATSKDGTRVPYFLVHRRDLKRDGSNPTELTAYGGFGVSSKPLYSGAIGRLWLARGGVYALANIRGGGEFGPAWHEAGRKTQRQRVFDDFAAVGQDLIARGITSPRRLGIRGRSNGGLLMGVEFTQHPELWHAVIIGVPLLDMLHFETMAAGASWVDEYGSVSKPDERAFLARISPLQNLRAGTHYPEPFIFTSTKDDRVGPVHARRFAWRMDQLGLPFLYYEDTEGGHAGTANLTEIAHEQALEATYLTRRLMD